MSNPRRRLAIIATVSSFAVALLAVIPLTGVRAGGEFDAIDAYVEEQLADSGIPGAAIAIMQQGEIVHVRGFGQDGNGNRVTPRTPFPIGSLTKSFTALAVMQLAETGAVDLDAPVRRYLPGFRVADTAASSRITVRHLMNQTSGFSRSDGIRPLLEQQPAALADVVAGLSEVELNRPVGQSYEYSNLNFVVLGQIVEMVTGRPWGEYVEQRILRPAGMTDSATSLAAGRENGMTALHQYWFGLPVKTAMPDIPSLAPTGLTLTASAQDMGRYLEVYLRGGEAGGSRLLSAGGIEQMMSPATNQATRRLLGADFTFRYGAGWFVGPFGGVEDARWHLGELPYLNAWMVLLPSSDMAVAVLINAGSQMDLVGENGAMSRIPLGIVSQLTGNAPPQGLGLLRFYAFFDTAVVGILGLQVWSLLRTVRWISPGSRRTPRGRACDAIPLTWEIGLSMALLTGFPALVGAGWSGAISSVPDLSVTLLAIAILWLVTATARLRGLVQVVRAGAGASEGREIVTAVRQPGR